MAIDIISVTIGFVGGIIGAVSGGVATYFAERKLEKRREKIGELDNSIVIFSKGVDASIEEIKEIGEQEFRSRNKDAEEGSGFLRKEMNLVSLNSYQPFINLTVHIARDIIVKKEENCFSAKTKDINFLFDIYKKDFDTLKQHFNLEFSTLDEYIDFMYSKAKTLPIFIQMKKEMPETVSKIDNLISEIEIQTK